MNDVCPGKIKENGLKVLTSPLKVSLLVPSAEVPHKERQSDIGWDVTLIGRVDNRVDDIVNEVNMFHTGIAIEPPQGYYFEMVARSSLHKTGYILATGMSVIDPEYRGELLVPLFKYRESDDIELPIRGVQLILKECQYGHFITAGSLEPTSRGNGGFGSTGGYGKKTFSLEHSEYEDYEEERPQRRTRPPRSGTRASNRSHMF